MGSDILPLIPIKLPLRILDFLLNLLTNKSNLLRRTSFLLIILFYLLVFYSFLNLRLPSSSYRGSSSSKKGVKTTTTTTTNLKEELDSILNFKPIPPTKEQLANHIRLSSLIESKKSSYSPNLFKIDGNEDNSNLPGVTAIILNWKRRKGLELVVNLVSKYPFIREIIIWNNNIGLELTLEEFNLHTFPSSTSLPPATLRIYNSPNNIHDAGKHIACSLASFNHCYFNDDDWLNIYMDSMYTKYLEVNSLHSHSSDVGRGDRSGNREKELRKSGTVSGSTGTKGRGAGKVTGGRIVSNTLPIIHLEHRRWRFSNPDIELHTGFSWLGTGSFSPKFFSTRFLDQQSSELSSGAYGAYGASTNGGERGMELLSREQTLVSDMFFSLWTNSFPEQMPNNLIPIDVEGAEVGWSQQSNIDQWKVVYSNILDAIRKLYTILEFKENYLVPFPFPISGGGGVAGEKESDLKAPSSDDRALFITNLSPFKDPGSLSFNNLKKGGGGGGRKKKGWSLFGSSKEKVVNNGIGATGGETGNRFNPYLINHIKDYESLWNEGTEEDGSDNFPNDEWWITKGSWHLAVDGKGLETCWESFTLPNTEDYFGINFVLPRKINKITLIGSKDLEFFLGFEKSTGRMGWDIMTLAGAEHSSRGWQTRRLKSTPLIEHLKPSNTYKNQEGKIRVTLELLDVAPSIESLDEKENQEDEEVGKISEIKFTARGGKKSNKLVICQIGFDDWLL